MTGTADETFPIVVCDGDAVQVEPTESGVELCVTALVVLSPNQAREVAAQLLKAADAVDSDSAIVRRR